MSSVLVGVLLPILVTVPLVSLQVATWHRRTEPQCRLLTPSRSIFSTAVSLMLKFSDGYGGKQGMHRVLASICGVIKTVYQTRGIHISSHKDAITIPRRYHFQSEQQQSNTMDVVVLGNAPYDIRSFLRWFAISCSDARRTASCSAFGT